jgi:hypothetical protein
MRPQRLQLRQAAVTAPLFWLVRIIIGVTAVHIRGTTRMPTTEGLVLPDDDDDVSANELRREPTVRNDQEDKDRERSRHHK